MKSYKNNHSLYMAGQANQIMNTLRHWLSVYGPDMQIADLLQKTHHVIPLIRNVK
ncbi:Z-ring formation inhibitor MciZ [Paenibacillus sp. Marseille-Q4541]|uniref:Z-ring formation inhibitor MciZ n=1 Tax=Paenibacillus sp. Marseille-Q4541 TaxID=2831522 RepID=UPI001BA7E939|nr:Z-ring formation inhibitor MciZ [Paenibacillus sp. Marseille-Q4541]